MGKIFGISNLPVSTIDKALVSQGILRPMSERVSKLKPLKDSFSQLKQDTFVKNIRKTTRNK